MYCTIYNLRLETYFYLNIIYIYTYLYFIQKYECCILIDTGYDKHLIDCFAQLKKSLNLTLNDI